MVYGVTSLLESFVQSDGSCASMQFGVAYYALSLSDLDKLKAGMQQAIKIQWAILRQGKPAKMLIVGVCGKPRLGALQANAFGIAFRNDAEETAAEFFHELFES
ncbi:hypothetical protein CRYUN_Cryun23aG0062000 [Craigia yunnanensis]